MHKQAWVTTKTLMLLGGLGGYAGAAATQDVSLVTSLGWVDVVRDADPRLGYRGTFAVGLATRLTVLGPITLGIELLNAGRGATFRDEDELVEQRSRYWTLPIGLGLSLEPGPLRLSVAGGLEAGRLQSCTLETGARIPLPGGGAVFPTSTQDCNDMSPGAIPNFYTRKSDLGAFADIELAIRGARWMGVAGYRTIHSMRTIIPPPRSGEVRYRSHWVRFGGGLRF